MLSLHRAERADGLAAALAQVLNTPLPDPLAAELVAVPTRGMERWLSQQLSARLGAQSGRSDGICAGVDFPPPRRLISDALAVASGIDPDEDPWAPERLAWPVLEVVDAHIDEPWLHALATYLGHGGSERNDGGRDADAVRRGRRLSIARHIARLFAAYALHRPAMVRAWSRGEDGDGDGSELAPEATWQAELWRAVRARVGGDDPAQRLDVACPRLREAPELLDLPSRLSVFGLTRLAAGELSVLRALSAGRDLHVFLLHPSPALWAAVAAAPTATGARRVRRRDDPTADLARHPLLASWGRDAREMQVVLGGAAEADLHHAVDLGAPCLLRRLHADVTADRMPPGPARLLEPAGTLDGNGPTDPSRPPSLAWPADARPPLVPDDRSVQVHACHGRARQVEVLRDAVLHLLAADPTLEPRDVIVMCPDVEVFAPLIQATFGAAASVQGAGAEAVRPLAAPAGAPDVAGFASRATDAALPELPEQPEQPEPGAPPDLRVRLADRSLRQTNPVLSAVAALLDLAGQRLTASQVLSFADREPVRRRFGLRDDHLARLQRWIAETGIRWGLDAAHRSPFRLDALDTGTWEKGLNRLLLGVAMTEDGSRLFGHALPLDDVESGAIELAGRFAELLTRLRSALDRFNVSQPLPEWADAILQAADALTATGGRDAWQRAELQRMLDEVVARAAATGGSAPPRLGLPEIRALLADRLAGRPTRANFRTGQLTVCTLYPMRSVPHRVVCLLGLDDGAFPRKTPRDGDDLMLAEPRIGERDPRSEDRQLMLDALMSATEHLLIFYTGNDERTNLPRPPAVPVGELLDVIDATVRRETGLARDQVLTRHPLQPFDPRNFTSGRLLPGRPWSHDGAMLAGAQALAGPRSDQPAFLDGLLDPLAEDVIELDDLVRFVQFPVRAFLRRRLHIYLGSDDAEVQDALPVELDGLERWGVGARLVQAALDGIEGRTACLAEIARGTLPPGGLGEPVLKDIYRGAVRIVDRARTHLHGAPEPAPLDVHVPLPDGRLLSGTVNGAWGDVLLTAIFSRVAPRHRLATWTRLLAAAASAPERPLSAVTAGRGPRDDAVRIDRIAPLGCSPSARREAALAQLVVLVDLYDRGMREPLPLFCNSSAAYAHALRGGDLPLPAARKAWASNFNRSGEDAELEHQLVLGGTLAFEEVLAQSPRDDEGGEGWAAEASRFGRLACRLWDGLLAREGTEIS